jgi:hypothetical protein
MARRPTRGSRRRRRKLKEASAGSSSSSSSGSSSTAGGLWKRKGKVIMWSLGALVVLCLCVVAYGEVSVKRGPKTATINGGRAPFGSIFSSLWGMPTNKKQDVANADNKEDENVDKHISTDESELNDEGNDKTKEDTETMEELIGVAIALEGDKKDDPSMTRQESLVTDKEDDSIDIMESVDEDHTKKGGFGVIPEMLKLFFHGTEWTDFHIRHQQAAAAAKGDLDDCHDCLLDKYGNIIPGTSYSENLQGIHRDLRTKASSSTAASGGRTATTPVAKVRPAGDNSGEDDTAATFIQWETGDTEKGTRASSSRSAAGKMGETRTTQVRSYATKTRAGSRSRGRGRDENTARGRARNDYRSRVSTILGLGSRVKPGAGRGGGGARSGIPPARVDNDERQYRDRNTPPDTVDASQDEADVLCRCQLPGETLPQQAAYDSGSGDSSPGKGGKGGGKKSKHGSSPYDLIGSPGKGRGARGNDSKARSPRESSNDSKSRGISAPDSNRPRRHTKGRALGMNRRSKAKGSKSSKSKYDSVPYDTTDSGDDFPIVDGQRVIPANHPACRNVLYVCEGDTYDGELFGCSDVDDPISPDIGNKGGKGGKGGSKDGYALDAGKAKNKDGKGKGKGGPRGAYDGLGGKKSSPRHLGMMVSSTGSSTSSSDEPEEYSADTRHHSSKHKTSKSKTKYYSSDSDSSDGWGYDPGNSMDHQEGSGDSRRKVVLLPRGHPYCSGSQPTPFIPDMPSTCDPSPAPVDTPTEGPQGPMPTIDPDLTTPGPGPGPGPGKGGKKSKTSASLDSSFDSPGKGKGGGGKKTEGSVAAADADGGKGGKKGKGGSKYKGGSYDSDGGSGKGKGSSSSDSYSKSKMPKYKSKDFPFDLSKGKYKHTGYAPSFGYDPPPPGSKYKYSGSKYVPSKSAMPKNRCHPSQAPSFVPSGYFDPLPEPTPEPTTAAPILNPQPPSTTTLPTSSPVTTPSPSSSVPVPSTVAPIPLDPESPSASPSRSPAPSGSPSGSPSASSSEMPSASPAPSMSPTHSCGDQQVCIDFSMSGDGTPLFGGQYVKYEWFTMYGMTIMAVSNEGTFSPDGSALVFNTSSPEDDLDLGSPNAKCTPSGPGVGAGGEPGSQGENCVPQGNVLVVRQCGAPGSEPGGNITFSFVSPVIELISIGLMDIAEDENTFLEVKYSDSSSKVIPLNGDGDNSVQNVTIDEEDVNSLTVSMAGCGAIRFVCACLGERSSSSPTSAGMPSSMPTFLPTKGPATVSGHLYEDTNGNGQQDSSEPNLPNVDVVVTDSDGNEQTVTTDDDGNWVAIVPPGVVTTDIDETDPSKQESLSERGTKQLPKQECLAQPCS